MADIERGDGHKIVYGRDWLNLGFKAGGVAGGNWGAYYLSLSDDVRCFYGNRDFKNNDLSKTPIMESVRTAKDFYLIFEVTAGANNFYFIALESDGICAVRGVQFTLMYFPTAYGTVDTDPTGPVAGPAGMRTRR